MHKKVGDELVVFHAFSSMESVRIKRVYEYPDGSIGYGFYSDKAGRNLLQDCSCSDCERLNEVRRAKGETYIGNVKTGALIKL